MTQESSDRDRLRALFDTHTSEGHHTTGVAERRSRLTSELVGCQISLPADMPVWKHVHPSSRELQRVPYDGGPLVVHNTEPAGSSFLVYDADGQSHAKRGPAVTLHRPEDAGHEDLLVIFAAELG